MEALKVLLFSLTVTLLCIKCSYTRFPKLIKDEERICVPRIAKTYPRNCYEAVSQNGGKAGLYKIRSQIGKAQPHTALCRYDKSGNIWMVIQRRDNCDVSFNRNWNEYRFGFGHFVDNFWMGLESVHEFTTDSIHELYIELETFNGTIYDAHYDMFAIGDAKEQFYLKILGAHTGTAPDAFRYHAGELFSTPDRDNDQCWGSCGEKWKSGWWYKCCHESNINNVNNCDDSEACKSATRIYWKNITPELGCLKKTQMMIRSAEIPYLEPKVEVQTTTRDPFDVEWN